MYTFNAKEVTDRLVEWIRQWFEQNGAGCMAVLGISGGKDSSVAAAACVAALGRERVLGVSMPDHVQDDIEDARRLAEHLGIRLITVDVGDAVDAVRNSLGKAGVGEMSRQAQINLPPRVRMTTLYAVSQCVNGRVVNTCNYSEDYVGYSTRYGDSAGDFSPLGGLTVAEVKQVGEQLGLPHELVHKTPSDGLSGCSDEDKLGFTYAVLDRYIRTGVCEDEATRERIDRLNRINRFKLEPLPVFRP